MNPTILRCLACLLLLTGCGKVWRSQPQPAPTADKTGPVSLEHWSGRADYTSGKWQITSRP